MKRLHLLIRSPLAIASVFVITSGLVIAVFGIGAVPKYKVLFGGITVMVGGILIAAAHLKRARLEELSRGRPAWIAAGLGAVVFLFLAAYLTLRSISVVRHPTHDTVYFPLWLQGHIAEIVQRTGGRYQALDRYGNRSISMAILEMPDYSVLWTLTWLILLLVYQGIFSTVTLLLLIFGFLLEARRRTGISPDRPKITILFLSANPAGTVPLRLDQEIRAIDESLRRADFGDLFDLRSHWALRIGDLQDRLLRHRPQILHFSGHGSPSSEIYVEDDKGLPYPVPPAALGRLFAALKPSTRCVVLNACYSEEQARIIAEHVDCVIGMSRAVHDTAAISFSCAFYRALGYGKDFQTAFDLGCGQIELENLPGSDTPQLLTHSDLRQIRLIAMESEGSANPVQTHVLGNGHA